jgi:DNA invertase Pin-like site-specific DNA recombinase
MNLAFAQVRDRTEKISTRHLERLAIVYIRQSSLTQVRNNQESTKLQYNLVELAEHLGWNHDRVLIIDEDLGISGKSAEGRNGFQRLLREVTFDHVGIILGVEISRLSRSSKDWYHLLEICARFGTLIADLDGLYDPSRYNDRLLLGLKGTMSEAELHILRQRLMQGKLNKAQRGELNFSAPAGYLRTPKGEIVMDPDEEVQSIVRLIFHTFSRVGTVHGVVKELAKNKIQIGIRQRVGPDVGQLLWHRPHTGLISNMLRHPIYAGIYSYGRRQTDPKRQNPEHPASGRTPLLPQSEWLSCIYDRLPAYISREQYEQNQKKLSANRAPGFQPREGSALLQGLVRCKRCGYRMATLYTTRPDRKSYPRYVCMGRQSHYGEPRCSGFSAKCLDDAVARLLLAALAPDALEISMKVSEQIEKDRERNDSVWQKKLQRAHYEAERAERQYNAVEPENRLVTRTLERAWETKLEAERVLQEEYRRRQSQAPRYLTPPERETIRRLSSDLPELWNAPTTKPSERKTIARFLIEEVLVAVDEKIEWMESEIHWVGGHVTSLRVRRPVGSFTSLKNHAVILKQMRELRSQGYDARRIAKKLNDDGFTTSTEKSTFNERLVRALLHRYGSVPKGHKAPPSENGKEWWLSDLAKELKMPRPTLYTWVRCGWLKCRRERGTWVAIVDKKELERLRSLREHLTRGRHLNKERTLHEVHYER